MEQLIRVTSDRFCAGAIVKNGIVTSTAPILKWMKGASIKRVKYICENNGHKFEIL